MHPTTLIAFKVIELLGTCSIITAAFVLIAALPGGTSYTGKIQGSK